MNNLAQLHTEFQVQALLTKYDDININDNNLKEIIKLLLPARLISNLNITNIDTKIYSLFEACNSCKLVNWLTKNNNKDYFLFKVLDKQVLENKKVILSKFYTQTIAEKLQQQIDASKNNSIENNDIVCHQYWNQKNKTYTYSDYFRFNNHATKNKRLLIKKDKITSEIVDIINDITKHEN